jgi:hypothetical protein
LTDATLVNPVDYTMRATYKLSKMSAGLTLTLSTFLGLVAAAGAAEWTTGTFNTNAGWVRNDALAYQVVGQPETGQNYDASLADQWYTDDPFNAGPSNGATSILKLISGWTLGDAGAGNNSVLFGGYGISDGIVPGTATPSIYRSFAAFDTGVDVTFTADFGLIPSSGLFPNKDRFGFNLLDSTGTVSLAEFVFNPAASGSGPAALGVQWVSGASTNDVADIAYGALYRITVALSDNTLDLTMEGLIAQTNGVGVVTNYATTNGVTLVSAGAIANSLTASDFQTVSMNWQLVSDDAGDPGDNYMLVNNVSVVPEPSTYALLGLAACVVGYMTRRRVRL